MTSVKKKILFVGGSLNRGGSQTVAVKLCNYFADVGYQVSIACLLPGQKQYDLDERIKIIDFSRQKRNIFSFFGWIRDLKKIIKNDKPDYIISFTGRINIITLLASPKNKAIVSERNDPRFDKRSRLSLSVCKFLYARRAKQIVFQTEEVKNYFSHKIVRKSVVIGNPISKPDNFKNNFEDGNRIVMVGRLFKQKNYFAAIEAFKNILNKHSDATLDIYGVGDLESDIKQYVDENGLKNKVILKGLSSNISKTITQYSIYLLSSLYEGQSNSLMEAMSVGMPCISTPVLGSSELIKTEFNGILLPDFSVQSIENSLEKLIASEELRKKCGSNAIDTMKSFYEPNIFSQWEELLK